jgi:hypothetical protein
MLAPRTFSSVLRPVPGVADVLLDLLHQPLQIVWQRHPVLLSP